MTGTITDVAGSKLSSARLEIKLGTFATDPPDVFAQGPVSADGSLTGACTSGESAGFTFDVDMRRGWNSVVVDFSTLEFRSEKPDENYRWLLPFCTFGCSE